MGIATFIVLLVIEVFFLAWTIKSKRNHSQEKSVTRIAELALFFILLIAGAFQLSFRWYMLLTILVIQSVISVIVLVKKTEKPYKAGKSIRRLIGGIILYAFAVVPAVVFLQYSPPTPTGNFDVAQAKYTWVDSSRIETFTDTGENRALTVDFWYPKNIEGKVPLVVFSHGAFGYSGSNQSTFVNLASNGYVVASIGHTYHAFFTKDISGKIAIVNMGFFNNVMAVNDRDDIEQDYYDSHEWLDLRIADEHFILNTIIADAKTASINDSIFSIIDIEKIGVFGHSLGGASFAQVARERDDIDAIINLDGSMLGEELGVKNGVMILNNTPYPVPLLNVYAEDHYRNAMELAGEDYENFYASRNAVCSYEVMFKNAGHMNFTDLPLFSPALAKLLDTGTIDARYCIEKTNSIILEFFNSYLKGGQTPNFDWEY
ncbi:MAG: hypothetical protein FWH57_12905 [Oscillospiraceae bacterium]|nr:hypothetical protein [Oscillospiraceae bacterium]